MITTNYLTHDANVFYGLEYIHFAFNATNFLHVRNKNQLCIFSKTISL